MLKEFVCEEGVQEPQIRFEDTVAGKVYRGVKNEKLYMGTDEPLLLRLDGGSLISSIQSVTQRYEEVKYGFTFRYFR